MSTNAAPITVENHRARLKKLSVDGGNLTYVDEGSRNGKPIMLIHGMPTSSWMFRNVIPTLVNSGLRVIAPDMLGFGASDKPADFEAYRFDRQAARLVALINQLGLSHLTLLVHDIGGPVAWELIDRHPQYVNGLIVTNTLAYTDGWNPPAEVKIMHSPLAPLMVSAMRSRLLGPTLINTLVRDVVAHKELVTVEIVRGYWLSLHEGTTHAFRSFAGSFGWWLQQFERHVAALRRLDMPAMTIWGKQDKILTFPKLPEQFARDLKIPAERMHAFDDASHFLFEDKPNEIGNLIVDFMHQIG
jgi:pimeloyl-ACP methyl ester carboxylesterase